MRIVTWNMGCNIPASGYRKYHDEAWTYLLDELRPDVALVQEAMVVKMRAAADFTVTLCDLAPRYDAGTAVLVREGLVASEAPKLSVGSATYVPTTKVSTPAGPLNVAAVHVYPGDEQHADLAKLVELLGSTFGDEPVLVGGDFNAARHFDKVYGGKKYARFFEAMDDAGFHDAHWAKHGCEIQSFWGRQAKEQYQDDHFFVSKSWASRVRLCSVVDNDTVRRVSDHGPVVLELEVVAGHADGCGIGM